MVLAGTMRFLVNIQQASENRTSSGSVSTTWFTKQTDVHADVEDLQGNELERAQAINADATVSVTLRHQPRLKAKDRVVFGDRTLQIVHVSQGDNRKRETVALCREAV